MTGRFSTIDEDRCVYYAGFMYRLSLTNANIIFWLLFMFVLLLMCVSSFQHHKSNALTATQRSLPAAEGISPCPRRKVLRLRTHYLSIVSLCFVLSITCTVLEVFALFNIEYCDGEDLVQLYWGFWSVLQVGSNIAIFGVMLQLWIVLGNVETPSWAVALGTPVLVFAALGWIFREIFKRNLQRDTEDDDDEENYSRSGKGRNWLSRAPTIVQDLESGPVSMTNLRRHSTA